jgi:hypothetical protein
VRLSLADLLIGGTALEIGYRVAIGNSRHFQNDSRVASGRNLVKRLSLAGSMRLALVFRRASVSEIRFQGLS